MKKGLFVTFEGPEGGGKSTQLARLGRRLEGEDRRVVTTREPGGTSFADQLRQVLLKAESAILPRAELLLLLSARADHVERVIQPALQAGQIVLCDRYFDSTVAYQGGGRRIDREALELLNDYATGGLMPDLTFLIHVDPSIGLGRLGRNLDRFEKEDLEFHTRVSDTFLKLAEESPDRFRVIDGTRGADEIEHDIYQHFWNAYPTFEAN